MEMVAGGVILLAAAGAAGEWSGFSLAAVSSVRSWRSATSSSRARSSGSPRTSSCSARRRPPALSTYAYVNPLVAVFLGWLFAGEAVTVRTVLAAVVIVAAVALIIRHGARRTVAPAEENIVPLRAEGGRR